MSVSNYAELAILDAVFNSAAFDVNALYMALHTDNPGETGASNEVVGGIYARQNVLTSFGAAAAGQVQNDTIVEFTGMPATTVMAISFWDAVTTGNCLWTGWLGGTPVSMFAANATDDVFTAYGHGLIDTDRVTFEARDGGGLPTGISEGTVYFARDATTDTFKVALTSGGTAINLTASGEGAAIKVAPKTVANAGDTVRFAVGAITVRLD
jgi:hypothetical protein